MRKSALSIAALMLSVSAFQAQACTTDTPISLFGNDGVGNGLLSNQGGNLSAPPTDLFGPSNILNNGGVVSQIAPNNGGGVAHLNGSADCSAAIEDAQMDAAALAAALSTPVWLEAGENFAISGGLGLSDGSTAVGATGLMRFSKNLSGFAGGAFNTNDTDLWAAKAGLRLGW